MGVAALPGWDPLTRLEETQIMGYGTEGHCSAVQVVTD